MKIFNEAGQLTEEGKKATEGFRETVKHLLMSNDDPNEVCITSSILKSIIGDMTTTRLFPGVDKLGKQK